MMLLAGGASFEHLHFDLADNGNEFSLLKEVALGQFDVCHVGKGLVKRRIHVNPLADPNGGPLMKIEPWPPVV